MENDESLVPEPPALETIAQKDEANRLRWVDYLKNLSPRIRVYRDVNQGLLDLYKEKVIEQLGRKESIVLDGWPLSTNVAFMLLWNSVPGEVHADFPLENIYLFCYGKKAFCITDFECDDEYGIENTTYSLSGYLGEALTWQAITERIRQEILRVEDMVPDPPSE